MSKQLPDFHLEGSDNKFHTQQDFANFPYLLLYFYPKDNTPGCTLEAHDFTRLKKDFEALGVQVVGVSKDSVQSHCNFAQKQDLSILLLSDPGAEFAKQVGAFGEKMNYGKKFLGMIRSTFLINTKTWEIEKEWINVKATGHAERMLKELTNK